MIAVADTSPINYLILIDHIQLLNEIFGQVILPSAVFRELESANAPQKVRTWIASLPEWVSVETAKLIDESLNDLDEGEREAIALAQEVEADILIIDERRGRERATALGLNIIGTLGVLDRARGSINIEEAIRRLKQTTFRASPNLLRSFLDSMNNPS